MNQVTVAYCGVHQTYQMALAAQEAGVLDSHLCSLFKDGRYGRLLGRFSGGRFVRAYDCPGLDSRHVREYPWPMFWRKIATRQGWGAEGGRLFRAHDHFDRWSAARLRSGEGDLVIGSETCAQWLFREAERRGALRLLDRPGIDERHLATEEEKAADRLGVATVRLAAEPSELREKKEEELVLADKITLCSDFQRQCMVRYHPAHVAKCEVVPLWVAPDFLESGAKVFKPEGPLRIIYAGAISLRKGVPFLCQAVEKIGRAASLTLVGGVQPLMRSLIQEGTRVLPPVSRQELKRLFLEHDVLVLPSLGDSFGFVAAEAMACGLPVIVSTACGVPVPDETWRVEPMDVDALARRLSEYVDDRTKIRSDGEWAQAFASLLSCLAYRARVRRLLWQMLPGPMPLDNESSMAGDAPVLWN